VKRSTFGAMIVIATAVFVTVYLVWPRYFNPDPFGPVSISVESIQLVAGDSDTPRAGQLIYRGGLKLTSDHNLFGGYSGLLVDPDTLEMLAVSDVGHWLHTHLVHEGGMLVGLENSTLAPAMGMDGEPLEGLGGDIEGLATDSGGLVLVSLERDHQILTFDFSGTPSLAGALKEGTRPVARIIPPAPDTLEPNGGMEALVALQDGVLLTVTESSFNSDTTTRGWLIRGNQFEELSYPVRDDFYPVAMALLPDGNVLTLERYYTPRKGPAARLCIIQRAGIAPGATLQCDNIAEIASPMAVDNFEGLRVVEGTQGETLVYLLSDDKFNPAQDTLLLMFELVDHVDQ
jgi:hypothetical protein